MSADKHRRLAIDVAYLRLASANLSPDLRGGFAVNIKWARAITPEIQDLLARGDVVLERSDARGRSNTSSRKRSSKRVSFIVATAQGRARLAAVLERRGADFGPVSGLQRIEPARIRKETRRKIALDADPVARRARQSRIEARLAAFRDRLERLPA